MNYIQDSVLGAVNSLCKTSRGRGGGFSILFFFLLTGGRGL